MTDGQGQPEGTAQGQGVPVPNPDVPNPDVSAPQVPPQYAPPPPVAPQYAPAPPPPGSAPQYAPAPPPGPYTQPQEGNPQYGQAQPGGPQYGQPQAPSPSQGMYQQPPIQGGWQTPQPVGPDGGSKGGKKALVWSLVVVLVIAAAAAGTYFYGKSSADDAAKKYNTAFTAWKTGDGAAILEKVTTGAPADAFPKDDSNADLTQATVTSQKKACDDLKATVADLGSAKAVPPSLQANAFSSLSSDYDIAKKQNADRQKKFKDFNSATRKSYQQFAVDCDWMQSFLAKIFPFMAKQKAIEDASPPETPEALQAFLTDYEAAFVPFGQAFVEAMSTCETTSLKPVCTEFKADAAAASADIAAIVNAVKDGKDPSDLPSTADTADKTLLSAIKKAFPGITSVDADKVGPSPVLSWIVDHYVQSLKGQVATLKAS